MESLALVVSIMIFIVLFSGPFALLLTVPKVQSVSKSAFFLLLRRFAMSAAAFSGIFLSLLFLFESVPMTLKALSLICIAAHAWAINREYREFISRILRRGGASR